MWKYFLAIVIAAFLWAKLEVEIEGEHGWASRLPTWRVEKHRLLDLLYGGRPLTGYHLWAFSTIFFFFHLPLFLTNHWTLRDEFHAIGGFTVFWVVEDFLWFLVNPHYGLRKFTRANVWWHKRWVGPVPLDYWVMSFLAVVLLTR